jgi:hypothetical protein
LYFTAAEVAAGIPEEDDDGENAGTDTEDDSCFDKDSEDDFDPELDEEDMRDMNIRY